MRCKCFFEVLKRRTEFSEIKFLLAHLYSLGMELSIDKRAGVYMIEMRTSCSSAFGRWNAIGILDLSFFLVFYCFHELGTKFGSSFFE